MICASTGKPMTYETRNELHYETIDAHPIYKNPDQPMTNQVIGWQIGVCIFKRLPDYPKRWPVRQDF